MTTPSSNQVIINLSRTSMALGRLHHALECTPLHSAWLWRETVRVACKNAQISGHCVTFDQLAQDLIGLPAERGTEKVGLAAAKRIFLAAAPLFRITNQTDSHDEIFELYVPLWANGSCDGQECSMRPAEDDRSATGARIRLLADRLAIHLQPGNPAGLPAALCAIGPNRPADLSPTMARLALPIALHRSGLLAKPAPSLIGGRIRLKATSALAPPELARALSSLAKEADGARRRLNTLSAQHRAWHQATRGCYHQDARAPAVLDLLTMTPVLSASLVARHLDCRPQTANRILADLADRGVLHLVSRRQRWKIYLASDLTGSTGEAVSVDEPLAINQPLPSIDRDAISATLDRLLVDLERANNKLSNKLT